MQRKYWTKYTIKYLEILFKKVLFKEENENGKNDWN